MIYVKVCPKDRFVSVKHQDELLDKALRNLRRVWKNTNMDNILRSNESYEKPSAKRRRKKHAAINRHKRAIMESTANDN